MSRSSQMRRWTSSISPSIWSTGRLTKRPEVSARSVSNLNRSANNCSACLRSVMSMERPSRRSGSPVGLKGRPPAGRDPSLATIAKPDPIFQVHGFTRLQGPIQAPLNEIPIVGMNGCLETRHADDFSGKIPKECPSLIGDPKDLRLAIQLPGPASAASAARLSRSSLARKAWSARFRASALANMCATNCSRFTSASGQSRFARVVLRPRMPNGLPPTESGRHKLDWMPNWRADFPVAGGFRWQIFQRSNGHNTTGEHLLNDPRKSLLLQLPGRLRPFLGAVKVGEP